MWSPSQGAVFWVDIIGQRLNRLVLAGETVTSWEVREMIGWVIERRDKPGFIAGLKSGFAELTIEPLRVVKLGSPEPDVPGNRMNDAKADARGRIFAGTMPVAIDAPTGGFYRFDPDRRITRLDSGYTVANGPAISPDGAYLLHTDSVAGRIYRFDILADGELGERQLFRQFEAGEGSPDGMTFDSDGGVWVALWGAGRVCRYDPDGHCDATIEVPASQPTSCCFAGDALDRMFVTSAAVGVDEAFGGALFEVETGRRGVLAGVFAG